MLKFGEGVLMHPLVVKVVNPSITVVHANMSTTLQQCQRYCNKVAALQVGSETALFLQ